MDFFSFVQYKYTRQRPVSTVVSSARDRCHRQQLSFYALPGTFYARSVILYHANAVDIAADIQT